MNNINIKAHRACIIGLCYLLINPIISQGQEIAWIEQYGTVNRDSAEAVSVYETGVYVVGSLNGTVPPSSGSYSDVAKEGYVHRYDGAGNIIWEKPFGNSQKDQGTVVFANYTGVYVAGTTAASPANINNPDILLVKYDHAGNTLWNKQFNVGGRDDAFGLSADLTGVYVVGAFGLGVGGFVYKFDIDGNEQWSYRMLGDQNGLYSSFPTDVAVDDTGVYVTGVQPDTSVPPGTDAWDAFVTKYDTEGIEIWTRQFGTSINDRILGVATNPSGIYIVGGSRGTLPGQISAGHYDAFIRMYDSDGNEQWTRQFGSSSLDWSVDVSANSSGIFLTGLTEGTEMLPGESVIGNGDAFVRAYDLNGNDLWTLQYGVNGASGIDVGTNSLYIVGRTSGALPGQQLIGDIDAYLMKIDLGEHRKMVDIDIKPRNRRNIINPRSKGRIWVAMLSDLKSPFDPLAQVDIPTVEFGPNGATAVRHKVRDINKDGVDDLLLRFKIQKTGVRCGDKKMTLTGKTFDDQIITGTDFIKTIRCKDKKHQ